MPGTGSVRADNAAHVTPDGCACPAAPRNAPAPWRATLSENMVPT